jgi:hypothetical protein
MLIITVIRAKKHQLNLTEKKKEPHRKTSYINTALSLRREF